MGKSFHEHCTIVTEPIGVTASEYELLKDEVKNLESNSYRNNVESLVADPAPIPQHTLQYWRNYQAFARDLRVKLAAEGLPPHELEAKIRKMWMTSQLRASQSEHEKVVDAARYEQAQHVAERNRTQCGGDFKVPNPADVVAEPVADPPSLPASDPPTSVPAPTRQSSRLKAKPLVPALPDRPDLDGASRPTGPEYSDTADQPCEVCGSLARVVGKWRENNPACNHLDPAKCKCGAVQIWSDSKNAVIEGNKPRNWVSHQLRHIRTGYHFFRDYIQDGSFTLEHMPGDQNCSDIMVRCALRI